MEAKTSKRPLINLKTEELTLRAAMGKFKQTMMIDENLLYD